MQYDLNDLQAFVEVAQANGYANASRKTGVPRATLSRRISSLEQRLGVRLIERSSRSFRLTFAGADVLAKALPAIKGATAVFDDATNEKNEPSGLIRFAVAPSVFKLRLDRMVIDYLTQYPKVKIQIEATDRRIDLLREEFDFAIRAREARNMPLDLVVLPLLKVEHHLVVSPLLKDRVRETVAATLDEIPALAIYHEARIQSWLLHDNQGKAQHVTIKPRLCVGDMYALKAAAAAGLGITLLPDLIARDALLKGDLLSLVLDLHPPAGQIHAIHSGQKGMRSVVRHFLNWLVHARSPPATMPRFHVRHGARWCGRGGSGPPLRRRPAG